MDVKISTCSLHCSRPQLESVDDGGCVVVLLDVAGVRVVVLLVVVRTVMVLLHGVPKKSGIKDFE